MRLPDRVFLRALAFRSLMVWLILRAFTLFQPLRPAAFLFLLGVVVLTVLLDAAHRREDLFMANLGVSRVAMALVPVAAVVFLEATLWIIRGRLAP